MGEAKNRSVRLDDENYGWLSGLPGRTLNDALTDYRAGLSGPMREGPLVEVTQLINRVEGRLSAEINEMPDADMIADVMRTVIGEFKAQKTSSPPANNSSFDPAAIPGVSRGPVGQFPCRCVHTGCKGSAFMGASKFANLCPECRESGHVGDQRSCKECYNDTGPS